MYLIHRVFDYPKQQFSFIKVQFLLMEKLRDILTVLPLFNIQYIKWQAFLTCVSMGWGL